LFQVRLVDVAPELPKTASFSKPNLSSFPYTNTVIQTHELLRHDRLHPHGAGRIEEAIPPEKEDGRTAQQSRPASRALLQIHGGSQARV
jgi:hypothetical protein